MGQSIPPIGGPAGPPTSVPDLGLHMYLLRWWRHSHPTSGFVLALSFLGDDPAASWFSSKGVQTILHLYEQYYAKDQMFTFLYIL